jgi:predicted metal-dependent peptidase
MLVKKGDYTLVGDVTDQNSSGKPGQKSNSEAGGNIVAKTPDMEDIPLVGQETPGARYTSDLGGETVKTKAQSVAKTGKSQVYKGDEKKVKTDWKKLGEEAFSRASGSLSDKAKRLLAEISKEKPVVDWKKELKKFFDQTLTSFKEVLPKKRYAGSGLLLRGVKKGGETTFKTVVAAVDTSGSISQEQSRTFVTEVMQLCKIFNADVTYIIYCSDDIDGIDIVKKGQKPDFTKWATTGGNNKGFIPPFEWVEKNKIKPSLFVYLTDTGGEMPNPDKYGISKYKNKVIWFLCGSRIYNEPPFGKIIWAPKSKI